MSYAAEIRAPGASRSVLAALGFAAAVIATSVVGGLGASQSGALYAALELPAWAPPAWLFSPVWVLLYVLIAASGWLVWRAARENGAPAFYAVYALQLGLNAAWPVLFFAGDLYGVALTGIAVLLAAIAATIALAWRHSRAAALLFVPYLAWVGYATALNAAIWVIN